MGQFKAIIIGGGPVGLVMAHVLHHAGIEYVLCEQRPKIETVTGAGFVMMTHGVRILHQLGLLEALEPSGSYLTINDFTGPGGKIIRTRDLHVFERHGYAPLSLERSFFLETLYQRLPNGHQTVKTGKRLVDIELMPDGVVAKFEDGTSEAGSIIMGADGIWSTVREIVRKLAPKDTVDEMPFTASYACHFGRGHAVEGLPENSLVFKVGNGWAAQFGLAGSQTIWILEKPIPESVGKTKYTFRDEEKFLEDVLDEKIYKDITVRDMWDKRLATGLTNLDKGVAQQAWYWDRVVLMGDVVHKPTPNIGAGIVLGTEAAVVLGNLLHSLLKTDPNPGTAALEKVFAAYQEAQLPRAKPIVGAGQYLLNKQTWQMGWKDWFITNYVDAWLEGYVTTKIMAPYASQSRKLDFLPFPDERSGSVPWADALQAADSTASGSWWELIVSYVRSLFEYKDKKE